MSTHRYHNHTINSSPNPLDFILSLTTNPSSPRTILLIAVTLSVFRASIPTNNPPRLTTLETLLAASNISVIFAPSLLHLRACLSTIPPTPEGSGGGVLAVWGLIAAHRETNEFSAQGLGRTVASVVDAGVRSGRQVVLGEGARDNARENRMDNGEEGGGIWWESEEVPLLNATVQVGSLEGAVAGRTVAVGTVLGRWFRCLR